MMGAARGCCSLLQLKRIWVDQCSPLGPAHVSPRSFQGTDDSLVPLALRSIRWRYVRYCTLLYHFVVIIYTAWSAFFRFGPVGWRRSRGGGVTEIEWPRETFLTSGYMNTEIYQSMPLDYVSSILATAAVHVADCYRQASSEAKNY